MRAEEAREASGRSSLSLRVTTLHTGFFIEADLQDGGTKAPFIGCGG